MNIKFKFNLEDKVTVKFTGRYGKDVLTVIGRTYSERIAYDRDFMYECITDVHQSVKVNEKMLEKYVQKKIK